MIKFKLLSALLCLAVSASPALAEIQFAVGEPTEDSTRSGIGQISGWAVSDVPIVSVEAFIDGVSVGVVPYGGTRLDVAAAFPDVPNSEFSGWAMKWNYSLLTAGEHVVTVLVIDEEGAQQSKDVVFNTTGFKSEFISDPEDVRTGTAVITILEDGHIIIAGAEVEGELVDIELLWDTASQQFQINKIVREEPVKENQAPTADAGPSLSADAGETVVVEGSGHDPDGNVENFSWVQVSGTAVDLLNADSQTVQFTAPGIAGTIRLRLTVTDDSGASDNDDALIDIVEPTPEPPPPEPENQAPTADAGADITFQTGHAVEITGSGDDSDGTVDSWNWVRVSGLQLSLQNANTSTVSFTAPDNAGTIQLRLTITDDDGATGTDEVTVTVEEAAPPPNQSPTADAGSDQTVSQGDGVTVAGDGSDPDGTITDWSWIQVSGPAASLSNADGQNVQFTAPDNAGDIRLRLTVTDNDGATDSDDVVITVEAPPETDNTAGETVSSMLSVINDARGQAQICGDTEYPAQDPLTWDSDLADIARLHSMDMAREGYFSHTSQDGTSMGDRVFPYWTGNRVGENIAASSIDRSNSFVVNLWMESPGHCALIMNPDYTHAGIGAGHDTENGYSMHHFWTLDFGG
jgi:uncharacterized protein YkwD